MRQVVEQSGGSLFCFAVYTENTGSTEPSHELELLACSIRGRPVCSPELSGQCIVTLSHDQG